VRRALVTCLAVAASVSLAISPARADRASDARAALGQLQTAESDALLQLFAADSAVGRARARADDLRSRARVQSERVADARREVTVGRANLKTAQTTLSTRLAAAFRAGDVDPFVILLSASSLSDALDGIAIVNRVSARDATLIGNVQRGLSTSRRAERALTAEQARLAAATAAADTERARAEGARAAKAALVAGLRSSKQIAARRLAQLEEAAAAARQKADEIEGAGPGGGGGGGGTNGGDTSTGGGTGDPGPPSGPVGSGQTLTVVSTAYAIHGTTATGIRTRRGICATDPRVIPLGTQFDVPGYGRCVAADTGGAVKGNRIDVWVETEAEALQWGFRTVTVSIL
jgi:3D (Asp-Asp-Asp) domain-containing protein/peptidoglycan hydrolase CwlO-like protein